MRKVLVLFGLSLVAAFTVPALCAQEQPSPNFAAKVTPAKKVFLDDQLHVPKVVGKAREQLLKWGRFELVQSANHADLTLVLSADPYRGGHVAVSGGQTGNIESNGQISMDPVPDYNKLSPVRYAYLTVVDPATNEKLWEGSHQWGGLLTGFDSVGAHLVKQLEKQIH